MKKKTLMIILGNLTAFGPFVTDFYLPCLPTLTSYFSVTPSVVQVSLTAGMLGLAFGQLLIGPLADKYGRKRPLLWCLALFVLATFGCIFSGDIYSFIFFRLLQGLTGASGLVISKVIIADTFTARDLAKNFAVLAAVQGMAPIVAPVIGGVAFSLTSWKGTFAVLGGWGFLLFLVCRRLKETLAEADRLQLPIWNTFRCYVQVVANKKYMIMNLLQGFSSAALMAYISASPFIFQHHFGLTPLQYSVCFACNAVGLVMGSTVVVKFRALLTAVRISVAGLLSMCMLTALALWMGWPFVLFEIVLFLMLFSVGMLTPVSITFALGVVRENKGVAAALLGAVPFLLGGIVAPLTGIGNMIRSMNILILVCAGICGVLCWMSRKWKEEPAS